MHGKPKKVQLSKRVVFIPCVCHLILIRSPIKVCTSGYFHSSMMIFYAVRGETTMQTLFPLRVVISKSTNNFFLHIKRSFALKPNKTVYATRAAYNVYAYVRCTVAQE